jgi:hypothetical protein
MVIPTDIQVAFITGAVFVDMGRRRIEAEHRASPERSQWVCARFRLLGTLYAGLFLGPVIAVFFSAWPAWETQYWTIYAEHLGGHPGRALAAGAYLFGLIGSGYLGSHLALRWLLTGKGHRIRPVCVVILLATLAILFGRWPAPVRLGSVAAFRADPHALPYIWQDATFFGFFLLLLAYCGVPYVVIFFRFRRSRA